MRFRFAWLWGVLAAVILLGTARAEAQVGGDIGSPQWLSDRQRAEGRGVRLGDFELHPGIGAEGGWVSNVLLSDPAKASGVLRVAPHLYLSTLGAERLEGERPTVAFRAGASGTLKHYFATNLGTDMGVGEDARLVLSPSRVFSAEVFDEYQRTIDPFQEASGPTVGPIKLSAFDRDRLGVGTRLQLSTPGGLFKTGVGYRFDIDHFESKTLSGSRNQTHTISADTSWEFLPKTALVWNGDVKLHRYLNASAAQMPTSTSTGDLGGDRYNSTQLDSKIGLNGALTQKVALTAAVGYGAGFFRNDNDYESVIAQVEARWRMQETALWALGYDRQFNSAFQGNFVRMDRLKTRLEVLMSGAFLLAAKVEFTFATFGKDSNANLGNRHDKYLLTNLSGEYRFLDWLAATAEIGYIQNFTNFEYPAPTMGGTPIKASYNQFSAWLGLRAFL